MELFQINNINVRNILALIETTSSKGVRPVLNGVCFHRSSNNEMHIASTDTSIMCKVEINNVIMNEQFNELVISGDSLKFLKDYKRYRVNIIVYKCESMYIMRVNDTNHIVNVINYEYPNVSNIKFVNSDNDYTISLSQNVIEKLLKVMKSSNNEVVTITFNTSSKMKPFKCYMKNYDDMNIDIIAVPHRSDF